MALKSIAVSVTTEDRGKAIGLCMALFGLSGGNYTAMFRLFFAGGINPSFFLFCGFSMSALMLIASRLVGMIDGHNRGPKADKRTGNMAQVLAYCIVATMLVCVLPFTRGKAENVIAGLLVGSFLLFAVLAFGLGVVLHIQNLHSDNLKESLLESASSGPVVTTEDVSLRQ